MDEGVLAAAGVEVRNGRWFVQKRDGSVEEGEMEIRPFATIPAQVHVQYGVTISMGPGSFEFARIEVGVTLPCYREEIEATAKFAQDWVGDRIEKERREVEAEVARRVERFDGQR